MSGAQSNEGRPHRPPFIVIEGPEGAGKTTQVATLGRWLAELGIPHVAAREPGGTPVGEALRSFVLGRTDLDIGAETELLVILAARAAFVRDVVRPALARGETVVSDRFDLSTFAYQGWGRGLDLETLRRISAFATGNLQPDLYILLDVPVQEGALRQKLQGKGGDRFELAGEAFLTRVREGYLALARTEPRVHLIDARGPADAVQEKMRAVLQAELPETFGAARG